MLLKHKGFSAVAIIALGLGIGANTAIFSLVNGVLLRPLPFPNSDRIIYFEGKNPAAGITDSNISYLDFTDWSQQTDLFASTAAYWTGNADLSGDGAEPEAVPRAGVTTGFFSVLGVQPVLGRAIVPEDDKPASFNGGRGTVAIISHGLWKRRFGSDPAIIGRVVQMKSRPLTVIGVMPPGFEYPEQTQIWVNSAVNLSEEPRDNRAWSAIARLNSNVDLKQAQTRVSAINARLDKQFHETNKGWDVSLWTLHERLVREVKPSLLALLGAVGLVLLIACANVANLLLARSAARQKEIAIRAAMGASRTRVLRQMLTESILLSAIGGIAGLILSIWLTDLLMSMLPEGAPRLEHIGIDYRVLAFALGVSGAYRHSFRHRSRPPSLEARRHQRVERRRTQRRRTSPDKRAQPAVDRRSRSLAHAVGWRWIAHQELPPSPGNTAGLQCPQCPHRQPGVALPEISV